MNLKKFKQKMFLSTTKHTTVQDNDDLQVFNVKEESLWMSME